MSEDTNLKPTTGDTNAKPKMTTVEVSEHTRYQLPEGTELPEVVVNSIREKDRLISEWNQTKSQEKTAGVTAPKELPDPYLDPAGYREALRNEAREAAREETFTSTRRVQDSAVEITTANNLVGEYFKHEDADARKDRLRKIAEQVAKDGGVEKVGDQYFYKPGAAENAFNKLYMKELIESARKSGKNTMGEELNKAKNAGTPIPAGDGGTAELPVDHPARFEDAMRQMADSLDGKIARERGAS